MKIIDANLLDNVSVKAKESPRLRMNYNFHQSLDEKCHRFLNAVEPGTKVEIHRHPMKDKAFVLFRGKVRVNTYNDDGTVIESVVLCPEDGLYGVDTSPRMSGIMWKAWSLEVYSLNVRKDRSQDSQARMSDQRSSVCRMKWKAFCACNDNLDLNRKHSLETLEKKKELNRLSLIK